MAWMEMNYNLKTGQFFKFFQTYLGEIAKTWFVECSPLEKLLNIFLLVLYEQFYVREKVTC